MGIVLRGMTWSHPRGYDPLVACCGALAREDRRRDRLGQALAAGLRGLSGRGAGAALRSHRHRPSACRAGHRARAASRRSTIRPAPPSARRSQRASVGPSYASYRWQGRQWALPIDAATQVQAWRPDSARRAARASGAMRSRSRGAGAALCPMRPPHSLMVLYTLTGNLGRPCAVEGPDLVDASAGAEAYERMRELTALPRSALLRAWTRSTCSRRWRRRSRASPARR